MNFLKLNMKTTALVTTTLIITLGIYDLVCVLVAPDTSVSVSAFLVNAGFNRPAIVFAIGFISGHLFGYMKPVGYYTETMEKKNLHNKAIDIEARYER